MPQIDSYTAGTVSLTNGSAVVNGVGTNWMSGPASYSVLAGHLFVCGSFFAPVSSVTAAGQLTLAIPYTGATVSGLAYRIFRYTWVETAAVTGFLQALLDRGSKTKPVTRWDVDSGAMTFTIRQDDDGNPILCVGATGAGDGSMLKALKIDKATGNTLTGTGKLGVHTGATALNYDVDVRGSVASTQYWMQKSDGGQWADAWIGGFTALDGDNTHGFLHIGGTTSADGNRRISLQASLISTYGRTRIGGEAAAATMLHVVATGGYAAGRFETNATEAPYLQMYKTSATTNQKMWDFVSTPDGTVFSLRAVMDDYSAANNIVDFARSGINGTGMYVRTAIVPATTNLYALGGPSNLWSVVFSATPTINTSDANLKDVRGAPTDAELDAWGRVRAKIFRFLDSVAAKGDDARHHTGWIAQEVAAAFEAEGLDPRHYALFCSDMVTSKVTTMVPGPVPVFDVVEEAYLDIEVIDGVPHQVQKARSVRQQRFDQVPVIGVDGQPVTEWRPHPQGDVVRDDVKGRLVPVTHPVPVMVDGEVEQITDSPAVEQLGLRYEECLVMEAALARREMARLHDDIAALTVRVAALEPAAA